MAKRQEFDMFDWEKFTFKEKVMFKSWAMEHKVSKVIEKFKANGKESQHQASQEFNVEDEDILI